MVTLPIYFGIKIEKCETEEKYYLETNEFALSRIIYINIAIFFVGTVIPLTLLTILNIYSIRKYRQIIIEKKRLRVNTEEISKGELRFTKTVITLNAIWIVSRCLDLIITVIYKFSVRQILQVNLESIILIEALRNFSNLIMIIVHSIEPLVYLKMDRNVRGVVWALFKWNKVTIHLKFLYSNKKINF